MFNKRINIFTGHFGSGKTEIAVNFALKLSKIYEKTAIADLDVVNPYFRSSDMINLLAANNILAITPVYAGTVVDAPALPAGIARIFEDKDFHAVFDVGGDDVGARIISRYRQELTYENPEVFFVINTRRPFTDRPGKIVRMISEIEASSRLKVTSLVNNTNVLGSTTGSDIMQGKEIIDKVSAELEIPVAFTSGFHDVLQNIESETGTEILYLEKYVRLPWE